MKYWHVLYQSSPRLVGAVLSAWLILWPLPSTAQGQVRQFPTAALRGEFEVLAPPNVLMDGAPARLSPGARIKNINNTLVMSASLVGQRWIVNYLRDGQGMVHEVWILNAAEIAQPRPRRQTSTNIVFESD